MILISHSRYRPLLGFIGERPLGEPYTRKRAKQLYDCPFTDRQMHYAKLVAVRDNRTGLYRVLKVRVLSTPLSKSRLITRRRLQGMIEDCLSAAP